MSYNELAEVGERFYNLGKRYGLLKEFRANGIPCQENHDLQPVNVVEQFTTSTNRITNLKLTIMELKKEDIYGELKWVSDS